MKIKLTILLFFIFLSNDLCSQKIISLMPSYTEILFALKADDKLVGVTNFCNYPEEAKKKEKVGDYLNPDIEKIYKLKPDIIFSGKWNNKIIDKFKNKNIKIILIENEKTIDDIYKTIKIIGKYTNKEEESIDLISSMNKKIKKIKKSYKKIYIEIDNDNWTCGSESFISDVISKAGGINIFNDIKKDYFKTDWEEIVKRNPEVIILINNKKENIISQNLSSKIDAVKNQKIYELDEIKRDIISRPSPRIVDIIEYLNRLFN